MILLKNKIWKIYKKHLKFWEICDIIFLTQCVDTILQMKGT